MINLEKKETDKSRNALFGLYTTVASTNEDILQFAPESILKTKDNRYFSSSTEGTKSSSAEILCYGASLPTFSPRALFINGEMVSLKIKIK